MQVSLPAHVEMLTGRCPNPSKGFLFGQQPVKSQYTKMVLLTTPRPSFCPSVSKPHKGFRRGVLFVRRRRKPEEDAGKRFVDGRSGIKSEEAHAYLCRQTIREVSEWMAAICPPL